MPHPRFPSKRRLRCRSACETVLGDCPSLGTRNRPCIGERLQPRLLHLLPVAGPLEGKGCSIDGWLVEVLAYQHQ
jgi:hypothetical protein